MRSEFKMANEDNFIEDAIRYRNELNRRREELKLEIPRLEAERSRLQTDLHLAQRNAVYFPWLYEADAEREYEIRLIFTRLASKLD